MDLTLGAFFASKTKRRLTEWVADSLHRRGGKSRSIRFPRSALVEMFSAGTKELRRSFERAFKSLPAERAEVTKAIVGCESE